MTQQSYDSGCCVAIVAAATIILGCTLVWGFKGGGYAILLAAAILIGLYLKEEWLDPKLKRRKSS